MSDFAVSRSLAQPVRVLEHVDLWGQAQVRIWVPAQDRVLLVPASDLSAAEPDAAPNTDAFLTRIAAARLRTALDGQALAAPQDANVLMLPHQLRALARATENERMRFLLADEVGLGKTIEAGLILRELKLRGEIKRILIVAPKSLVLQWVQEMRTHFQENFQLVQPADLNGVERTPWDANPWQRLDQIVVGMDSIKPLESRRGWNAEQVARYNQTRFQDLLAAGWDLIIVDEAHRIAGSHQGVARYQMGLGLAGAAPYLLLLSATPHSGKRDAFLRLMNLLDTEDFPLSAEIDRARVRQYVIRTEKRQAVGMDGKPLFQPRQTRLLPVEWRAEYALQQELYERVTDYVREGYNQAIREQRHYVGFLLLLMQRLVASSTDAIRTALEKRATVLHAPIVPQREQFDETRESESEFLEADGQTQLDEIIQNAARAQANELSEVESLLNLARRCQADRPDAKAEALLDLLVEIERAENDARCKFLVFTEFVPTQNMLREFLSARGYEVVVLNGAMDLDERQRVQKEFAGDARVLVSTDAGGEGLNLQYAYIAINYDIPWSPTKIEQRIGRVDRIGQTHPVRAFNMVIADSVDYRVQDVLQEKLKIIFAEFGVDKTSDILDSADAEADFEALYRRAIVNPAQIEQEVDALMAEIRKRTADAQGVLTMLTDDMALDAGLAQQVQSQPLAAWVERVYISGVRAAGGECLKTAGGYQVRAFAQETWESVRFVHSESDSTDASADSAESVITLGDSFVQSLLHQPAKFVRGQSIPAWRVSGLAAGVTGFWSLWRIALGAGETRTERLMPLFAHDDGRVLAPSALHVWERLARPDTDIFNQGSAFNDVQIYDQLYRAAQTQGESIYQSLRVRHEKRHARERDKGQFSFNARRAAIERIGLQNVRRKRLADLAAEENAWADHLQAQTLTMTELEALVVLHVSPN